MKADSVTVQVFFHAERRLLVPLYQRPYVWKREDHWEPLWDDIRALAERVIDGKLVRPHFLGAVVLEQIRTGIHEVQARLIIDGQQRLTTLQLLLSALRELCSEAGAEDLEKRLLRLTCNEDADAAGNQRFKVWPTNLDRPAFSTLLRANAALSLPSRVQSATKEAVGEGLLVKAFTFFVETIREWLQQTGPEDVKARATALVDVIRNSLHMVVIDLGDDDEAQVIFETLNARGTPLLPADLVKNFLFQAAAQGLGSDLDGVYKRHWEPFDKDADYWRKAVKQGRFFRPQIDLYLQHYLTLLTRDQVSATHLFSEFKEFVVARPEWNAEMHLESIHRFADVYRGFDGLDVETRKGGFFYRLEILDTTTLVPFLLGLYERFKAPEDKPFTDAILADLESFLVRRMICRLTTKNYNKLFLDLIPVVTQALNATEAASQVRGVLLSQSAESARWPTDSELADAWMELPAYRVLSRARLRMVLEAVEAHIRTELTEQVTLRGKLTVEHLLPQAWTTHWPIPEGADESEATEERNRCVHQFGNLTLLTKQLNPAVSNSGWAVKHPMIMQHSALALNRALKDASVWDEAVIRLRTRTLLESALEVWPHPLGRTGGANGLT